MLAAAALGTRRFRRRCHVDWAPPVAKLHRGKLAARRVGEVGVPVLLVHGLAASGQFWGARFDALGRTHRLVVPDLLGFGDSPKPPSGYGPAEHIEALLACLAEVGADDEPTVVVGHSMGALLAISLAASHPERVRAVVAFSAPLYHDRGEARARIRHLAPMARLVVLDTATARRACQWVCAHRQLAMRVAPLLRPDLPAPIAADGMRHTWDSYSQSLEQVILAADTRALFSELAVPVQLVAGGRDRIAPPALLEGFESLPGVGTSIWDGRGHDLPLECPDACVEAIEHATRHASASRR